MATETNGKKKTGRPKAPPAPPALGIAERSGDGWKFTIVLGGLKVNGKRFDPQAGAELLAGMLEDGMKRIPRSPASPEKALADLEAADSAETGGGDHHATNDDGHVPTAESSDADHHAESSDAAATSEPAMAPGQDGANGSH